MLRAIIMAGGRGSRAGHIEKPLLKICGKPIIQRVIETVRAVGCDVYVSASLSCLETVKWCIMNRIKLILTKGFDYIHDLNYIVKLLGTPLLVLPADMPFLTPSLLDEFIDRAMKAEADVVTLSIPTHEFLKYQDPDSLAFRDSPTQPSGITLFKSAGGMWTEIVMSSFPELLNLNTYREILRAEYICKCKRL